MTMLVILLLLCAASAGFAAGYAYRAWTAWLWEGDGQDRKFAFRRGRFVNRVSGEAIPLDEPVIIFRARDRHALPVLRYYRGLATDPHHREAIAQRIYEFGDYARRRPLKEPGITRDIRLGGDRELQLSADMEVRPGCGWLGCETYDPMRCAGCHGAPA